MQNYLQSALGPLFQSYQNAVIGEQKDSSMNIKALNYNTVQNKMNELVTLLSQAQKNSNIPTVKLEWDPDLQTKMEEIRSKSGKEATAADFETNDDYITKLSEYINKWKVDISQVIKLDTELSKGDTLNEINFWRDYEATLKNIKSQIESPEVQMTLKIVENARKVFIIKGFQEDTKIDEPIKRVELYNILLKDLPIISLTTATQIPEIAKYLKKIFEH